MWHILLWKMVMRASNLDSGHFGLIDLSPEISISSLHGVDLIEAGLADLKKWLASHPHASAHRVGYLHANSAAEVKGC